MQITTIILAGGKSKRMGTDKALLELDGQTLLERAIELCKPISSELLISSNHQSHTTFGYPVIEDEIKNCGPMGGISSGLKQSKSDWNLVLSVDAAFVDSNFLKFLLANTGDFDAVIPFTEKGAEPLIALYNKSILPAMGNRLQSDDYRMQNLLKESKTNWLDAGELQVENKRLFTNLNRPEDLQSSKF
ncbi:molybdenum cofactor guanylyltransferase [Draconibacterium halophilum]|uniref:Probable molybdenum cofactor guanylyltransferase n=1 Tax=Draconibacterium halophilum TaxID=2706887 RepID=A0A6C0RJE6_9BACT|nr:molybdenum cofactor guanylyltransferase [Draconibacterium halophilum]QIA09745.1 molybdenum cofactor guanylyltransferase [Draconibacterium halophilum]